MPACRAPPAHSVHAQPAQPASAAMHAHLGVLRPLSGAGGYGGQRPCAEQARSGRSPPPPAAARHRSRCACCRCRWPRRRRRGDQHAARRRPGASARSHCCPSSRCAAVAMDTTHSGSGHCPLSLSGARSARTVTGGAGRRPHRHPPSTLHATMDPHCNNSGVRSSTLYFTDRRGARVGVAPSAHSHCRPL